MRALAYIASADAFSVDETERIAAGEFHAPRGELVLTAPVLFGRLHILPIVADFLAAYPEINIRLLLSDRNLHLLDDHVDMAARIGVLPDSGLVCDLYWHDAKRGLRQPEAARRAWSAETARGSGGIAERQFRLLLAGFDLDVPVEGREGQHRRADPAAALGFDGRGCRQRRGPGRRGNAGAALSMRRRPARRIAARPF